MSWNIQFGLQASEAADALEVTPELVGADVILLQEMDEAATEVVAGRLGWGYVYAPASVHPTTNREFGNAVLSPWPLSDRSVDELPYRSALQGQLRVAVSATVATEPHPVRAFSVHTEVPTLRLAKRRHQFGGISDAARRWDGMHLVVGGDFNTISNRSIRAVTERLSVIGAVPMTTSAGPTLRRSGSEFRLDHIYARGLSPAGCGVVHGLVVSDHRPLWARLNWAPPSN